MQMTMTIHPHPQLRSSLSSPSPPLHSLSSSSLLCANTNSITTSFKNMIPFKTAINRNVPIPQDTSTQERNQQTSSQSSYNEHAFVNLSKQNGETSKSGTNTLENTVTTPHSQVEHETRPQSPLFMPAERPVSSTNTSISSASSEEHIQLEHIESNQKVKINNSKGNNTNSNDTICSVESESVIRLLRI
jgi:hypothetical protein